ncbi:hypothetical protein G647_09207 [Cladophialophora carrionii CBS 160.54]|uniref:MalT-like TPR region domain-containing protein n=1 Tax=Cladophialophora carrionii CBS 160.54 TaxID=1279043 RepID=V9CXN2_9EURO|nr:uncharacterized protein G647_09207 [Cladophialophora carrionii CBS 160.54]ETI19375.1 hypothetical protein G647_09207 [Cladophialophora carrionii CBS 160.54]
MDVSTRADYDVGKVYYDQGLWDTAKACFSRAEALFTASNPIHSSTTAAQLKLACIAMKQGRLEDAIPMLRQTLLICKLLEDARGDRRETARVMRRLAEALDLAGQSAEAAQYKEEAESIRKELQGARFDELGDTEQSYNMLMYVAFW